MRHLTSDLPKPLLRVGGKSLLEHHLAKLKAAGIEDIYINTFYLGEKIRQEAGNGSKYGVKITYINQEKLLNSGGDTFNALSTIYPQGQLSDKELEPFFFVSADIYSDFDYGQTISDLPAGSLGRLVMVETSDKFPDGCQYAINDDGRLLRAGKKWNWASMGVFHPKLFDGCRLQDFPLTEVFDRAVDAGQMQGEKCERLWFNLGTPEDLHELTAIIDCK